MNTNDHHLVKEFKLLDPPVFMGSSDIAVGEEWFRVIEKKLGLMRVTDEERVILATSMLKGVASHWWDINRCTMDIQGMTWREFEDSFLDRYYPFSDRNFEKIKLMQSVEKKRFARYPCYAAEIENLESMETGDVRMSSPLREQRPNVLQYGAPKEIEVEDFSARMKNKHQNMINPNSELILPQDPQQHPYSQHGLVVNGPEVQHILQNKQLEQEEKGQQQLNRIQKAQNKRVRQWMWKKKKRRQQLDVTTVTKEIQVIQQQPEVAVVDIKTQKQLQQQSEPMQQYMHQALSPQVQQQPTQQNSLALREFNLEEQKQQQQKQHQQLKQWQQQPEQQQIKQVKQHQNLEKEGNKSNKRKRKKKEKKKTVSTRGCDCSG
ncbi:putative uncharacterized protein DDB_G0274435 [Papaver somniferum]|uniref:putative uncharacterized protein DDB_G0274435 n=1 Tax=Papaver somniferum TaxID=3469 RepID=UPI000E6FAFBE|nr:putative uncharacterized protein DDB_G0274435 [Papaver somniferum]